MFSTQLEQDIIHAMIPQYKHIALGGTFDHFHKGHRTFLEKALEVAEKVSVGITTDEFAKKLGKQFIESYDIRKNHVEEFVYRSINKQVQLFPLTDVYGIAVSDKTVDALLVTADTQKNAQEINKKRKEVGLKELAIVVVPLVQAKDNTTIRSERIRNGEIDSDGEVYLNRFTEMLYLPQNLRTELRKPFGKIIQTIDDNFSETGKLAKQEIEKDRHSLIIAVGDVVSHTLEENGLVPDISVIDHRTRRREIEPRPQGEKSLPNDAGTINPKAAAGIQTAIKQFAKTKKSQLVSISGEEDLLALPSMLLTPLGSVVLYGQFDRGMVLVTVTEELKKKVAGLLEQFKTHT